MEFTSSGKKIIQGEKMKTTCAAVLLAFAFSANVHAQPRKMSPPPMAPKQTYNSSYSVSAENEVTGLFGMVAGSPNFGVTYIRSKTDFGFGGYFFMQSSKDKNNVPVVSQVMAFGGLMKVTLMENRMVKAYIAPGFGIAMVKDGSTSAATGKKSDETIISPIYKLGVQFKASPNFIVGLERFQLSNWLNDSLNSYAGPSEYYSITGTFEF
jgi:opacity protein-like surface antigen